MVHGFTMFSTVLFMSSFIRIFASLRSDINSVCVILDYRERKANHKELREEIHIITVSPGHLLLVFKELVTHLFVLSENHKFEIPCERNE